MKRLVETRPRKRTKSRKLSSTYIMIIPVLRTTFTPAPLGRLLGSLLVIGLALQGCATTGTSEQTAAPTPETLVEPTKVADRSFETDTLYALLVAEMAIDRKRYDIALSNYVQQSISTRDPDVTARATQIARILQAHQPALEMSELWVDLEPKNSDALLIATAELIEANRLEEAFKLSSRVLTLGGTGAFDAIALKASEGDIQASQTLSASYQQLLEQHPENQQLLLGYSVLLQQADRKEEALAIVNRVLEQDPANIRAAFQETSILQQMGKQDLALQKLGKLVADNPDNYTLRARYARVISASDLNESRRQFQTLHNQSPNDTEVLFSLALVEKELGHLESSATHFRSLVEKGFYLSSANYHLGEIHEKNNQNEAALTHYTQVKEGRSYLAAMSHATAILGNSGRELEALNLIREQREQVQGSYREGLYMLESDVMATAGQMKAAGHVLSDGLEEFPDSTRLLYSRAMLYTRIDYITGAEQDLKLILTLAPNNAAALNALGYTLADRTERLDEAYIYISKAFKLTPDDPAVIDSMGWIEFRRGNYNQALEHLRQAMIAMPDHEIAAHLGEVLWVTGGEAEARKIWQQGLKLTPQSSVIRETLDRLKVELN